MSRVDHLIHELKQVLSSLSAEARLIVDGLLAVGVSKEEIYEILAHGQAMPVPRRSKKSALPANEEEILRAIRSHVKKDSKIAEEFGVSLETVQNIARTYGRDKAGRRGTRRVRKVSLTSKGKPRKRARSQHKIHACSKGEMKNLITEAFRRHNWGPIGVNTVLEHVLAHKPTHLKHEPKRRMMARVQSHLWRMTKDGELKSNGKLPGTNSKTWTMPV